MAHLPITERLMGLSTDYEPRDIDAQIDAMESLGLI